jgi:hypothetical protein
MLKAVAQTSLALLALPLAAAAAALVAFPCAYMSESASVTLPGGVETVESGCESLLEYSPGGVLFFVGPPILLVLIGATGAVLHNRWVSLITGALVVQGGMVISILAFGLFPMYFAPAGICLLVAGLIASRVGHEDMA